MPPNMAPNPNGAPPMPAPLSNGQFPLTPYAPAPNAGAGAYGGPPAVVPVFPNGFPWQQSSEKYQSLFQDTGFVYTYLAGHDDEGDPDRLQMHEVDLFTTLLFDFFGNSTNGLRVTPGFTFHFLDGPSHVGKIVMPSKLYSGYLDLQLRPQLTPQISADLNFRAGVYSDMDKVSSDSVRFTGRGLGVVQLTPTTTLKLGVEYLDRNDVKIFPAIGFLWEPDENRRYDIYFPRPKFSHYWTTRGNSTIWWHVGAEYGGGAWTFKRTVAPDEGTTEQADINDIRIFTGIEWDRLQRVTGLLEIGYVFEREIYVRNHRDEDLDLDDTVMIRGGIKF